MEALERVLQELKGREDFLQNCMKSDEVKGRLQENKRVQLFIQQLMIDKAELKSETLKGE